MNRPNLFQTDREQEAAEWLVRIEGGPLSPAARAELAAWLGEDEGNAARLAALRELSAKTAIAIPAMPAADFFEPRSSRRSAARRWSFGLGLAAAAAVALFLVLPRSDGNFVTAAGQRCAVELADGTRAELNARTAASVRFDANSRRVRLDKGEAFFAVTNSAGQQNARPFYVETPVGAVRVTGTQFNVRLAPGDRLEVTVLEGSVAVTAAANPAPHALAPGDQLSLTGADSARRTLDLSAAEDVVAWRKGQVVFDATPLADAAARYAEYHGKNLAVAADVAALPVGGRYALDDVDGFLRAMESLLPVRVLREPTGLIRLVAK